MCQKPSKPGSVFILTVPGMELVFNTETNQVESRVETSTPATVAQAPGKKAARPGEDRRPR